jgi:hypothetical protein
VSFRQIFDIKEMKEKKKKKKQTLGTPGAKPKKAKKKKKKKKPCRLPSFLFLFVVLFWSFCVCVFFFHGPVEIPRNRVPICQYHGPFSNPDK